MRNVILLIGFMFLATSCATVMKFPTSNVTPAAVITAKSKKDKNNNYQISVTTNNLASADRLSSPKKMYVIWINTKDNGIKNIGQLQNKNGQKSTLETTTPFEPEEIFITAENEGNITYPSGAEITRVKFKN